jgi:TM2 domain-containing membrane protein YozV
MTAATPRHPGTQRDPNMAGGMSFLLPGLGQLYNGEQRKGMLFAAVGLINYVMLGGLIMANSIIDSIRAFGMANNMKLNGELARSAAFIVCLVCRLRCAGCL